MRVSEASARRRTTDSAELFILHFEHVTEIDLNNNLTNNNITELVKILHALHILQLTSAECRRHRVTSVEWATIPEHSRPTWQNLIGA